MASNPSQFPQAVVGGSPSFASVTVTGSVTAGPLAAPLMALQATTGAAGFALQNGTPNIITWTTPNDGNPHRVIIIGGVNTTLAETGGAIQVAYTPLPTGTGATTSSVDPGGHAAAFNSFNAPTGVFSRMVAPNTAVTVQQSSALTAGTAVAVAEIWGS